tara:strand:- start:5568 stop:5882 length:315 start_codon:yes stop_codon:yes gene_type:complete
MSTTWHGGKGDKPRYTNYKQYTDNYNNIFGTKAIATSDIWGASGDVDIIESDTVTYKVEGDKVRVCVIIEAPYKFGEASGNAGHPLYVTQDVFDKKYKPYLKII